MKEEQLFGIVFGAILIGIWNKIYSYELPVTSYTMIITPKVYIPTSTLHRKYWALAP